MSRVFTYVPGDCGSIPGRLCQRLKKWYLEPLCLTLRTIR